jgi:ElaA protein
MVTYLAPDRGRLTRHVRPGRAALPWTSRPDRWRTIRPNTGKGVAFSVGKQMTFGCEWRDFAELSSADLYQLLQFRQAVFVVEQASAYADLDGLDQQAHHLLLREGGALAGYLRLIPYPAEKRIAIGRVSVGSPWRGRGLARTLMQEALARCRRDYLDFAVTVSAQEYLVPFYRSLGFEPTSAPYDDYGVPHVDMKLDCRPGAGRHPPIRDRDG